MWVIFLPVKALLKMPNLNQQEADFLERIKKLINNNLSDESFGVSELAKKLGIDRSSLLRNIKKATQDSPSVFIRKIRLEESKKLLLQTDLTISEIAYQVGFGSPSYFIKCFKEQYGHPPGETDRNESTQEQNAEIIDKGPTTLFKLKYIAVAILLLISLAGIIYLTFFQTKKQVVQIDKSIAVLPFVNNSSDTSNAYFVNGVMESILDNLQKIEDAKVVSRTSVQKYRDSGMTLPEIAKELNVNYVVEGSGQKIGNRILLHVQLIQSANDQHLWSDKFDREINDIFSLQSEVAKTIAKEIEVVITPKEEKQIDKLPTENVKAYDLFLQALEHFQYGNRNGLYKAIPLFLAATKEDPEFALAYANVAIGYYMLDLFQTEKTHTDSLNNYADKAMLLDPELPQSLVAKAFYYMQIRKFDLAESFLLKAYEYHPNSALVFNTLSDFYANYSPNTAKYLQFALKGIQLDISSNDSATASYIHLHVSNALVQSGFVDEALFHINRSSNLYPQNPFVNYLKAYINLAKTKDMAKTKDVLVQEYLKDTTRIEIVQEVAKLYYYLRDFDSAYVYYNRFLNLKESNKLDVYTHQYSLVGEVYARKGLKQQSEEFFGIYKEWADNDQSIYKNLSLAMYYLHKGNIGLSKEKLRLFAKEDDVLYWFVLFLMEDPLIDPVREDAEYMEIIESINQRFWERHHQLRTNLEANDLL